MKSMPISRSASGKVSLVLGNSLKDIKKQPFCSKDLVIIDPPFNWNPLEVIPWVDEAVRICKPNGNIILFNDKKITKQLAEIYRKVDSDVNRWNIYKGLDLKDFLTIKHKHAKLKINALPNQTMLIAVLSKSSTRKFYAKIPKSLTNIWDPDGKEILTNNWSEKKHKVGHHGKFKILETNSDLDKNFKHSTATAEWVIERLLSCYIRPGDVVYDCFGGAGTVPYLCEEYEIECRSVEKDKCNFNIMLERLLRSKSKNRIFATYARKITEKVNANKCGTNNGMGTSLSRSTENREQDLEQRTETNRSLD